MKTKHKLRPRALFPIMVILILAFIFYTIIDSAILYGHISAFAMIGAGVVLCLLALAVFRFTLSYYEYLVVGNELIIRRRSLIGKTKISEYYLDDIESIGKIDRFSKKGEIKQHNCCNSIWATLFGGTVMLYHDRVHLIDKRIIIEPPAEICRVLRLNLQNRYKR